MIQESMSLKYEPASEPRDPCALAWQGGKLEMDVEALARVVARSGMPLEKP